ncbi:MAG: hypothetical protein HYU97_04200 [Deltaproteobacteria bacterium]|nr:hypothetical protein [Deltaproteobacteria bacterium]
MPTTIQIENKTLLLLKRLKTKFKVKTYDEIIRKLISKKVEPVSSLLGAHSHLPSFSEQDHLFSHDEED